VLLVARERGGDVVVCACREAETFGVRAGHSLAQARSLIHGLAPHIEPYCPEEYADKLRRLARWAERFSPTVAPDDPDGLMLDIAGCQHLFRGEDRLLRRMAEALRRIGLPARLAVAPTAGCAWAVARFGKSAIASISDGGIREAVQDLPVAALRIDLDALRALGEVGVATIGQLRDVSRNDLSARFGDAVLRRIDQLDGVIHEGVSGQTPEERFEVWHEFDGPITRAEIVETVVRRLLQDLLSQLHAAQLGILHLSLSAMRVNSPPAGFSLSLTRATHDEKHLWKLLHPRLERLHMGHGVEAIRMTASRTDRITQEQWPLWGDVRTEPTDLHADELGKLLDLLMERFGRGGVERVTPMESHVPERAFVKDEARRHEGTEARSERRDRGTEGQRDKVIASRRPSRLFGTPEPVRVMALVPDGPPAQMQWRGKTLPTRWGRGPERIALPWWSESGDGGMTTRDYFEVELIDGRRLWMFRLNHDDVPGPWFVHGEWA